MSVRECQQKVSSREFAEWLAYDRIEPFGQNRADLRSAIIAATIANVNRDPKKRAKPFTTNDFMPEFGPVYVMTPEETADAAKVLFGQLMDMQTVGLLGV